jgi:hypothetical protein
MEKWPNERDSRFTKEAAITVRSAQLKHGTSNKLSNELLIYWVGSWHHQSPKNKMWTRRTAALASLPKVKIISTRYSVAMNTCFPQPTQFSPKTSHSNHCSMNFRCQLSCRLVATMTLRFIHVWNLYLRPTHYNRLLIMSTRGTNFFQKVHLVPLHFCYFHVKYFKVVTAATYREVQTCLINNYKGYVLFSTYQ